MSNKYQEALDKLIHYLVPFHATSTKENAKMINDCLNTFKELVDKETPHSLSYEGDGYDPTDGELVYDTAICECGRYFEIEYEEHYKYCPSCGRRLDWSEE